jgi:hypothetical protein
MGTFDKKFTVKEMIDLCRNLGIKNLFKTDFKKLKNPGNLKLLTVCLESSMVFNRKDLINEIRQEHGFNNSGKKFP